MSAILRVAGWAALIIGLVWSVVNFIFVGWIALLFWLIVTFFLTVLLFGLVEVLERLEDQELKLLALRDSLEKLMKQDGLLAEGPQQCRRCGTQLPPGGQNLPHLPLCKRVASAPPPSVSAGWRGLCKIFLKNLKKGLAFFEIVLYNRPRCPGVAQLVARLTGGQEAVSSSLATRTI